MGNPIDIKKIIKESGPMRKYHGVAPEGFILVHEKTLDDLKNWYIWDQWKEGKISLDDLNKNNLEDN